MSGLRGERGVRKRQLEMQLIKFQCNGTLCPFRRSAPCANHKNRGGWDLCPESSLDSRCPTRNGIEDSTSYLLLSILFPGWDPVAKPGLSDCRPLDVWLDAVGLVGGRLLRDLGSSAPAQLEAEGGRRLLEGGLSLALPFKGQSHMRLIEACFRLRLSGS